jgi:large subunit ribosomal protein L13
MKTINPAQAKAQDRKWYVVDAEGQTLGRMATQIANLLRGKLKADFAPHVDNGDYVIVINCDKFHVTGNKMTDKMYHRHTGFLGGLVSTPLEKLLVKKPGKPVEFAVRGMLPKNKLRADMLARLKVFSGAEHTYGAQKPEVVKL